MSTPESINSLRPLSPLEERVRDRVMRAVRREKKVGWLSDEQFPRIEIMFHAMRHATKSDAEKVGKFARAFGPHILGFESHNHSQSTGVNLTDVSFGRRAPPEIIMDTEYSDFSSQLLKEIHNLNAIILPFDYSSKDIDKIAKTDQVVKAVEDLPIHIFTYKMDFESALSHLMGVAHMEATDSIDREAHCLQQLEDYLVSLLADPKSELRKRKKIKMFLMFGAAHTPMHHQIRREHKDARMVLGTKDVGMATYIELVRVLRLGRVPSERLVVRAFAELMFSAQYFEELKLLNIAQNSAEEAFVIRRLVNSFTTDEVKKLYQGILNNSLSTTKFREIARKKIAGIVTKSKA